MHMQTYTTDPITHLKSNFHLISIKMGKITVIAGVRLGLD